jgi:hypothetical protein
MAQLLPMQAGEATISWKDRPMLSRRNFLTGSAVALVGVFMISGRAQAAAIPEAPTTSSTAMQPPLPPPAGQDYQPVVRSTAGLYLGG